MKTTLLFAGLLFSLTAHADEKIVASLSFDLDGDGKPDLVSLVNVGNPLLELRVALSATAKTLTSSSLFSQEEKVNSHSFDSQFTITAVKTGFAIAVETDEDGAYGYGSITDSYTFRLSAQTQSLSLSALRNLYREHAPMDDFSERNSDRLPERQPHDRRTRLRKSSESPTLEHQNGKAA
jgi:hypothetical protein